MKAAPKKIYLISDSTGELGERFINALISQFPHDGFVIKKFNFVQDEKEARRAFTKISGGGAVLFHTVILKKLKEKIQALSKGKKLAAFDLTGPPTDFLMRYLKAKPVWDMSVIHTTNQDYDRRIDAIEYAIGHDDGAGGRDITQAEAILVGPSRSSKTPTSMYLATKGYKIANIPLIRQIGEPDILASLKGDRRVVAMDIHPQKLHEVRLKRSTELGTTAGTYTDLAEIRKELAWVRRLYAKYGWKVIEVSDRAIEETAALVVKRIQARA